MTVHELRTLVIIKFYREIRVLSNNVDYYSRLNMPITELRERNKLHDIIHRYHELVYNWENLDYTEVYYNYNKKVG